MSVRNTLTLLETAHIAGLRNEAKRHKGMRSAFSEDRRITVEDVFYVAGKHNKKGEWVEHTIPIIGSGLGHRIYPPRQAKPERANHREYLWIVTCDRKYQTNRIKIPARDALDIRYIRKFLFIAFYFEGGKSEFCRIENLGNGLKWSYST